MDELTAIGRARRLVESLLSAPIDVAALVAAHGMEVRESDLLGDGEAGNTFRKGGKTFIVINKNDDPYRRRFTALHELGHHILDLPSNHEARILSNELERFVGRPIEERLCDVFAAECLVPWHLIRPLVADAPFSLDVLHQLSERFQASRPCIASSFVRASKDLVAYVFAEGGRVQNVVTSASLRDARVFVQSGMIPSTSAAALALANGTSSETAELDGSDWSSSDLATHFTCYEEVLHIRTWKQTLSLLTFERIGRSRHDLDSKTEQDELLRELTGQLPWPKR